MFSSDIYIYFLFQLIAITNKEINKEKNIIS